MPTALPWGAPLSEDDLAAMPDDGHRYELLGGALLVTPAPNLAHQRCVVSLVRVLADRAPPSWEVLVAPFDVRLAETTVLQPDVLVAPRQDLTDARLEGAPALAAEVLSPSSRLIDLGAKRLAYEAAGVPAYWLVDPDVPSLTVLHLEGERYVEHAVVAGHERYVTTAPLPVTVVPAQLLEPPTRQL